MKKLYSLLLFCNVSLATLMFLQGGEAVADLLPRNKHDAALKEYNVLGINESIVDHKRTEFIGLDDPEDSDNEIDLYVPNRDGALDIWKIKRLLESGRNVTLTLRGHLRSFTANDLRYR